MDHLSNLTPDDLKVIDRPFWETDVEGEFLVNKVALEPSVYVESATGMSKNRNTLKVEVRAMNGKNEGRTTTWYLSDKPYKTDYVNFLKAALGPEKVTSAPLHETVGAIVVAKPKQSISKDGQKSYTNWKGFKWTGKRDLSLVQEIPVHQNQGEEIPF